MSMLASLNKISFASLLAGMTVVDPVWDRDITGVQLDSRKVKPGNLFLACVGSQQDGREYIQSAIENGATAILAEGEEASENSEPPIFYVNDLHKIVGKIAARFYQHPSRHMHVVGITGTNGKTSCSHFIAAALTELGESSAVMGTLGYGQLGQLTDTGLTTPDAISVHAAMHELQQQNVNYCAMEVSSHALSQGRVNLVEFDTAIFTNLTHDHLDYHGTLEEYGAAKKQLFSTFGLRNAVINIDDEFSQKILSELAPTVEIYRYSLSDTSAEVHATTIETHKNGISAQVKTPWGDGELRANLLGRFNLSNLLAVLTTLCLMDKPLADVLKALESLDGVSGRMQRFTQEKKPLVVIDYAHTPDALEKALLGLREHCTGKIWCVFGCGGGRDADKRAQMGRIAEEHADSLVITDDNPRHDKPETIVAGIVSGLKNKDKALVEHDRKAAIELTLAKANETDVVLIAGKGHETYQQIGDVKHPFNDAEVVCQSLHLENAHEISKS